MRWWPCTLGFAGLSKLDLHLETMFNQGWPDSSVPLKLVICFGFGAFMSKFHKTVNFAVILASRTVMLISGTFLIGVHLMEMEMRLFVLWLMRSPKRAKIKLNWLAFHITRHHASRG